MPFVNIKIAGPSLAPEQVRHLHVEATRLMEQVLRKKGDLTSVLVEQVSAVNWSIGIKPVKAAAHLEVKVTAGTNTPEEKARFVAEAMALLRSVLGPDLSPVTYVVIHDVPGEAWGYDGRTQADRALVAKAA